MRRTLLILIALLNLTSVVSAQGPTGVVGREVPDQVGVFEVRVKDASELRPGDILTVLRTGESQGEAVILSIEGTKLLVSTKGETEARPGDEVRFARRPTPQGGQPTQATRADRRAVGYGGSAQREPLPAKLKVSRGAIYMAPTGYVRVQVTVRNVGEQESQPDTLECRWTAFGMPDVIDTLAIPPLAPGEVRTGTIFSMIRAEPDVVNQPRDSIYAEGGGHLRPNLRLGSEKR